MTYIDTSLGRLEARIIHDENYPGIQIGLNVDGKFAEFAWVEVDEEEKKLKVHAYDAINDEPVFNSEDTEQDIVKYYNM